jgi:dienelactone hydrolase
MRTIFCAIILFHSFCPGQLQAKSGSDVLKISGPESGEYSVGFQLLEEVDTSRMVTGGASPSSAHPRPIRIYMWYPAKDSEHAKPMLFGRYAELANEDIWAAEIAGSISTALKYSNKVLARSLGSDRFEQLLRQPVGAIETAPALNGPFPLIIIGQGLYYESPIAFAALAEYLAGWGFVVATSPLTGTNSPIVRMNVRDLETYVRDLEYVITRSRGLPFVSQDKLGVFGFDMGGMAGLILTMRNADVDAFASVSSGILYENPEGIPQESPSYDPLSLRVPWLHSVPVYWVKPADSQAKSLFDSASHSDRYLLLTNGLGHVDYTSYALIEGRSAMSGYWAASNPAIRDEHNTVDQYVSRFFTAFLKQDSNSLAFLSQDPKHAYAGSTMTLQHRPATPDSITYEEFVQAIVAGQADRAIERVRLLKIKEPDHILLNESYLERLVWSLRDTWGLTGYLIPVINFIVELFPESQGAQQMLAEGYISVGDYPSAIEVYKKLLEKTPKNQYIKTRLEWLQGQ